jgi:hypothetical protein
MSKNKEINPKILILFLIREKNLILFFSILWMIVFLLYSIYSKHTLKTIIIIKDPPTAIFEPYNSIFYAPQNYAFRSNINNNLQQIEIGKNYLQSQFILSFHNNIKSIYNFRDFLKIDNNFQKFYKSKNINFDEYFKQSNFSSIKNKEKNNNLFVYEFIFPEDVQGDIFFKNYVLFTQTKTMVEYETEIKETIHNSINYEQQILNYIKRIDINSIIDFKKNTLTENLVSQNFNDLTAQIEKNKTLYRSFTYKKLDHNPFFEEPSKPTYAYKYFKLLYSLAGLSFGFLLSLIIIYFKYSKKYYKE